MDQFLRTLVTRLKSSFVLAVYKDGRNSRADGHKISVF